MEFGDGLRKVDDQLLGGTLWETRHTCPNSTVLGRNLRERRLLLCMYYDRGTSISAYST